MRQEYWFSVSITSEQKKLIMQNIKKFQNLINKRAIKDTSDS